MPASPSHPAVAPAPFIALAKRRCSVRAYESRPVEPEKAAAIVEAAHVAPSAANRQPVRIVQVETPAGLRGLEAACNAYGAPLAFVACVDHARSWKRPLDGRDSAEVDAAIATDHMMLAATDLGLGSLWIGMFDPEALAHALDLPANLDPVAVLAVGYAAGEPSSPERHASERIPVDELVVARR